MLYTRRLPSLKFLRHKVPADPSLNGALWTDPLAPFSGSALLKSAPRGILTTFPPPLLAMAPKLRTYAHSKIRPETRRERQSFTADNPIKPRLATVDDLRADRGIKAIHQIFYFERFIKNSRRAFFLEIFLGVILKSRDNKNRKPF